MAIKYSISGRCRNEDAVNIYICNLLKALKIHRLSAKSIDIEFKGKLEDESQGYCVGDKSQAHIHIAKKSFDEKIIVLTANANSSPRIDSCKTVSSWRTWL